MAISYIKNTRNNLYSIEKLSWKALHRSGAVAPFQLTLANSNALLQCTEIVRTVPQKRLVAFGRWNNTPVVVKLFYQRGKKSREHCQRDAEGIAALVAANIPTPKLLYRGSAEKQRIQILLFERIDPCVSLEDKWQKKTSLTEIQPLMQRVIFELATHHVLGILQRDLHFKNFLIAGKKIYTLDGGSIEKFEKPLSKRLSLENLGVFFAQLGAGTEKLRNQLFQYYAKLRGWLLKKADMKTLESARVKANATRWRDYHKKIFRNCTAFKKIHDWRRFIMFDSSVESPEFLAFLNNPESAFKDKAHFLKAGRTSSIVKIEINHRPFIVKRYNIKSRWHRLRRYLRTTRAVHHWQISQHLQLFSVATAKPIACIENRFFRLGGTSYFVMDYVEGKHLGDYFSAFSPDHPEFAETARSTLELFSQLNELLITHGDLKMTNILISHKKPVLIDLDGAVEHVSLLRFQRAFQREMSRFMRNWEKMPAVYALFAALLEKICHQIAARVK